MALDGIQWILSNELEHLNRFGGESISQYPIQANILSQFRVIKTKSSEIEFHQKNSRPAHINPHVY